MSATLIVRHPVTDYATWRATYDSAAVSALHAKHGATDLEVLRTPDDATDVVVIHRFATAAAANAFASDPELRKLCTGSPRSMHSAEFAWTAEN